MIDTVIFSKNRPAQCELLLRSIKDNTSYLNLPTILYKASTKRFDDGYDLLMKIHPEFNYIKEINFMDDVKQLVNKFESKYCLFLVDDSVFTHNISVHKILPELLDFNVHGISLRLNPKVNYCYSLNTTWENLKLDSFICEGIVLYRWNWRQANPQTDWGYAGCIDSHIYKTGMIKFFVNNSHFTNPNVLEIVLDQNKQLFKPTMLCFNNTVVLTIPNNKVQEVCPNNRANINSFYSTETLNEQFLDGLRIDTDNIYNVENNSVHLELDYKWIQSSK